MDADIARIAMGPVSVHRVATDLAWLATVSAAARNIRWAAHAHDRSILQSRFTRLQPHIWRSAAGFADPGLRIDASITWRATLLSAGSINGAASGPHANLVGTAADRLSVDTAAFIKRRTAEIATPMAGIGTALVATADTQAALTAAELGPITADVIYALHIVGTARSAAHALVARTTCPSIFVGTPFAGRATPLLGEGRAVFARSFLAAKRNRRICAAESWWAAAVLAYLAVALSTADAKFRGGADLAEITAR